MDDITKGDTLDKDIKNNEANRGIQNQNMWDYAYEYKNNPEYTGKLKPSYLNDRRYYDYDAEAEQIRRSNINTGNIYRSQEIGEIGLLHKDYGESYYDKYASNVSDLEDLNEVRAREQGVVSKVTGGLLKYEAITVLGTVGNIVGTVVGVFNGINEAISGDESKGNAWQRFWNGYVTNDVNQFVHDTLDYVNEQLPVYESKAEKNMSVLQSIFTPNFVSNTLANLGWTSAAIVSTVLTAGMGAASGASTLARVLGASKRAQSLIYRLVGACTGSMSEAATEAIDKYNEAKEVYTQNISQRKEMLNNTIEAELREAIDVYKANNPDKDINQNVITQLRENILLSHNSEIQELNNLEGSVENNALGTARKTMGLNVGTLTLFNTFGLFGNIKVPMNSARQAIGSLSNIFRKNGSKVAASVPELAARKLVEPISEGTQELLQNWAGNAAMEYHGQEYSPYYNGEVKDFITVAGDKLFETLHDKEAWKEFVAGAVGAGVGAGGLKRVSERGSDGKMHSKIKFDWVGGIKEFFDLGKQAEDSKKIFDDVNAVYNSKNLQRQLRLITGNLADKDAQLEAAATGDKNKYMDYAYNQMVRTIEAFADLGRINDLRALVGDPQKMSDEELEEFVLSQVTPIVDENGNTTNKYKSDKGFVDANGELITNTKEGKEKLRKKLTENTKTLLKTIDFYNNAIEEADEATGYQLDREALTRCAWGRTQAMLANERADSLVQRIYDTTKGYKNKTEVKRSKEAAEILSKTVKNLKKELKYLTKNEPESEEKEQKINELSETISSMESRIESLKETNGSIEGVDIIGEAVSKQSPFLLAHILNTKIGDSNKSDENNKDNENENGKYLADEFLENLEANGLLTDNLKRDVNDLLKLYRARHNYDSMVNAWFKNPQELINFMDREAKTFTDKQNVALAKNLNKAFDKAKIKNLQDFKDNISRIIRETGITDDNFEQVFEIAAKTNPLLVMYNNALLYEKKVLQGIANAQADDSIKKAALLLLKSNKMLSEDFRYANKERIFNILRDNAELNNEDVEFLEKVAALITAVKDEINKSTESNKSNARENERAQEEAERSENTEDNSKNNASDTPTPQTPVNPPKNEDLRNAVIKTTISLQPEITDEQLTAFYNESAANSTNWASELNQNDPQKVSEVFSNLMQIYTTAIVYATKDKDLNKIASQVKAVLNSFYASNGMIPVYPFDTVSTNDDEVKATFPSSANFVFTVMDEMPEGSSFVDNVSLDEKGNFTIYVTRGPNTKTNEITNRENKGAEDHVFIEIDGDKVVVRTNEENKGKEGKLNNNSEQEVSEENNGQSQIENTNNESNDIINNLPDESDKSDKPNESNNTNDTNNNQFVSEDNDKKGGELNNFFLEEQPVSTTQEKKPKIEGNLSDFIKANYLYDFNGDTEVPLLYINYNIPDDLAKKIDELGYNNKPLSNEDAIRFLEIVNPEGLKEYLKENPTIAQQFEDAKAQEINTGFNEEEQPPSTEITREEREEITKNNQVQLPSKFPSKNKNVGGYLCSANEGEFGKIDNEYDEWDSYYRVFDVQGDTAKFEFYGDEERAIANWSSVLSIVADWKGDYKTANAIYTLEAGEVKRNSDGRWIVTKKPKLQLVKKEDVTDNVYTDTEAVKRDIDSLQRRKNEKRQYWERQKQKQDEEKQKQKEQTQLTEKPFEGTVIEQQESQATQQPVTTQQQNNTNTNTKPKSLERPDDFDKPQIGIFFSDAHNYTVDKMSKLWEKQKRKDDLQKFLEQSGVFEFVNHGGLAKFLKENPNAPAYVKLIPEGRKDVSKVIGLFVKIGDRFQCVGYKERALSAKKRPDFALTNNIYDAITGVEPHYNRAFVKTQDNSIIESNIKCTATEDNGYYLITNQDGNVLRINEIGDGPIPLNSNERTQSNGIMIGSKTIHQAWEDGDIYIGKLYSNNEGSLGSESKQREAYNSKGGVIKRVPTVKLSGGIFITIKTPTGGFTEFGIVGKTVTSDDLYIGSDNQIVVELLDALTVLQENINSGNIDGIADFVKKEINKYIKTYNFNVKVKSDGSVLITTDEKNGKERKTVTIKKDCTLDDVINAFLQCNVTFSQPSNIKEVFYDFLDLSETTIVNGEQQGKILFSFESGQLNMKDTSIDKTNVKKGDILSIDGTNIRVYEEGGKLNVEPEDTDKKYTWKDIAALFGLNYSPQQVSVAPYVINRVLLSALNNYKDTEVFDIEDGGEVKKYAYFGKYNDCSMEVIVDTGTNEIINLSEHKVLARNIKKAIQEKYGIDKKETKTKGTVTTVYTTTNTEVDTNTNTEAESTNTDNNDVTNINNTTNTSTSNINTTNTTNTNSTTNITDINSTDSTISQDIAQESVSETIENQEQQSIETKQNKQEVVEDNNLNVISKIEERKSQNENVVKNKNRRPPRRMSPSMVDDYDSTLSSYTIEDSYDKYESTLKEISEKIGLNLLDFFQGNHNANVKGVLNKIANTDTKYNTLARKLLSVLKEFDVPVYFTEYDDSEQNFSIKDVISSGFYDPNSNSITIKLSTIRSSNSLIPTLLHEIMHAIVANTKKDKSKLEELTKTFYQVRKSIFKQYGIKKLSDLEKSSQRIKRDLYGLNDIDEFISEIFVNDRFAKIIDNAEPSWFEKFIDWLFGKKTKLSKYIKSQIKELLVDFSGNTINEREAATDKQLSLKVLRAIRKEEKSLSTSQFITTVVKQANINGGLNNLIDNIQSINSRETRDNLASFIRHALTYYNDGLTAEIRAEMSIILSNAKRDSNGNLLAPNGKPSNLRRLQYALVRTKAFKNWFGDWEKVAPKRISLGKILPTLDPYGRPAKYGQQGETDLETREVLDENGNVIGEVRMEFRGKNRDETVVLHPTLNVQGKGYGQELYQYIANTYGIPVEESFGEIPKSNAAQKMWNSMYKKGLTQLSNDEDIKLRQVIPQSNFVSKVVDENGEPLVVYHGSTKRFTEFKENKIGSTTGDKSGFYFTNKKGIAKQYYSKETGSTIGNLKLIFGIGGKSTVYDVFLKASNPYIENFNNNRDTKGRENIIKNAREQGHDVVILKNIIDGPSVVQDVYVVFNPNQIKSATDNVGNFSSRNNNITDNIDTLTDSELVEMYYDNEFGIVNNKLMENIKDTIELFRNPDFVTTIQSASDDKKLSNNKKILNFTTSINDKNNKCN